VGYDPTHDRPPERPGTLDDLGFDRRAPVRWYSPFVLGRAALQVMMASAFGRYLDKRELQAVLSQEPFEDVSGREDAWIDFVADTGDGFDATYTIAYLVGRSELEVDGLASPLPRADALVFGGDLVYPDATVSGYEHRFVGPFTAALPWMPPGRRPAVFAVPGNHDWYDGLTSFMRVFGQQKSIGGWQTQQTRSYYALKLPHGWWLWGIDVQLDAYIDEPQLRFFDGLDVKDGDRVILAVAEPTWVDTAADLGAYRNLGYVERKLVAPKGARAALALSGDLHHYARYEADGGDRQKITAGGGGAFLHPTHGLPSQVPVRTAAADPATETVHELVTAYPAPGRSRWLAAATLALPVRNPSFGLLPAALSLLLTVQVLGALNGRIESEVPAGPADGERLVARLGDLAVSDAASALYPSPGTVAVGVLVLLALVGFAKPPRSVRPRAVPWVKAGMGAVHTLAHLAVAPLIVWAALRTASLAPPGWAVTASAALVGAVLGAAVGGLVFAAYLTVANVAWAAEGNHAFSAQQRSDHKNFLRLHVRDDGAVEVYGIGVDRACRRWAAAPDAAGDDAAWVAPAGEEPVPRLIDHVTLGAPKRADRERAQPGS
jgi:hypothetical protein